MSDDIPPLPTEFDPDVFMADSSDLAPLPTYSGLLPSSPSHTDTTEPPWADQADDEVATPPSEPEGEADDERQNVHDPVLLDLLHVLQTREDDPEDKDQEDEAGRF